MASASGGRTPTKTVRVSQARRMCVVCYKDLVTYKKYNLIKSVPDLEVRLARITGSDKHHSKYMCGPCQKKVKDIAEYQQKKANEDIKHQELVATVVRNYRAGKDVAIATLQRQASSVSKERMKRTAMSSPSSVTSPARTLKARKALDLNKENSCVLNARRSLALTKDSEVSTASSLPATSSNMVRKS